MMDTKQLSKTESILQGYLDGDIDLYNTMKQFGRDPCVISMIRKREPKKTRPVCNTDRQSFILM